MNKSRTKTMIIPADILAELDDVADKGVDTKWSEEMDTILLAMWGQKKQDDLARWWKKKYGWGSRSTLRDRFNKLADSGGH